MSARRIEKQLRFKRFMNSNKENNNEYVPVRSSSEMLARYSSDFIVRGRELAQKIKGNSLEHTAKTTSQDTSELYLEAVQSFNQGDYRESILLLNQILEIYPNWAEVYCDRGNAKFQLGERKEAIHDFEKSLEIKPNLEVAHYSRGRAYLLEGEYVQALSDSKRAISINPNNARNYILKGLANKELCSIDIAISDFTHAIRLDGKLTEAYYNRGLCYWGRTDRIEAISDFSSVIKIEPNNLNSLYNRGVIHQEMGNLYIAIEDYNSALNVDPRCDLAYFNRGLIYYTVGKFDLSINDYTKALEINPNDVDTYIARGKAFVKSGVRAKALEDYNKGLIVDPQNGYIYILRGLCNSCSGHFVQAKKDLKIGIDLLYCNPDFDSLMETLSTDIAPGFYVLHNLLICTGDFHFSIGNFEDAIEDYYFILQLEPNNFVVQTRYEKSRLMYIQANGREYIMKENDQQLEKSQSSINFSQYEIFNFVSGGAQIYRSIDRIEKFNPEVARDFLNKLLDGAN
jgi:tetratricopeptide (TPR) repeat protein